MQRGSLDDLRDKTVLTFADNDVTGVTVTGVEEEPVVLEKSGNEWSITSPIRAKADATQVRSLLSTFASAAEVAQW